jgi:pimeloyl-ACP methyl ester carboxylesterase
MISYLFICLLIIWAIAVQAGCFAMRTSDANWVKKWRNKGQALPPQFLDVQDSTGRRIHAVAVSAADSLLLVVLVHGSPGSADAYLDYLADTSLAKKARLVAIDRPGFGYTEGFGKPEPSQKNQALALKAVADQLAPNQKVVLVGHSMGGPVVARFAMEFPEQTAGLVIVAGSVDPAQEKHPWWQQAIHVPPLKWLTPKSFWTSNAEIIPLEKELEQMLPLWPRITCPVRLLHAANDRLVPVANVSFAQKMLVNCPNLKVEILPKGDHFFLWTNQAVVKKAILEAVDGGR